MLLQAHLPAHPAPYALVGKRWSETAMLTGLPAACGSGVWERQLQLSSNLGDGGVLVWVPCAFCTGCTHRTRRAIVPLGLAGRAGQRREPAEQIGACGCLAFGATSALRRVYWCPSPAHLPGTVSTSRAQWICLRALVAAAAWSRTATRCGALLEAALALAGCARMHAFKTS